MQVLASIGQLEFFYDQAPDVMRSCSMALQLLSVAAGSYLSGSHQLICSCSKSFWLAQLAGLHHCMQLPVSLWLEVEVQQAVVS